MDAEMRIAEPENSVGLLILDLDREPRSSLDCLLLAVVGFAKSIEDVVNRFFFIAVDESGELHRFILFDVDATAFRSRKLTF